MERNQSACRLDAGYGEQVITPPLGLDLAGYGFYLDRRAESVLDDLRAKALVLRSGGSQAVIVSCDLIGLSVECADAVRRDIAGCFSLEISQVLLACTHTHSGPATKSAMGLGNMDPGYMNSLRDSILKAVRLAGESMAPATFFSGQSLVEPFGFNRRTRKFDPIDPVLSLAVFGQKTGNIHLISYACHPVTLGPTKQVSADWPGALARELEKDGHHCIVLQGCCGDIDPVTNLNQWGGGTPQDVARYGAHLAQAALRIPSRSAGPGGTSIRCAEARIDIPLSVWSPEEIRERAARFAEDYGHFPGAIRFAREWQELALERHPSYQQRPFIDHVPLQVLAIGNLKILAIPGEVFCEIGLRLRSRQLNTWVIGYANGTVGYIPNRRAYRKLDDYACYCAPRFQSLFPFSPEIERIIVRTGASIAATLK